MKKFTRALAFVSAVCIGASCFCGCSKNEESKNDSKKESDFSVSYNETKAKGTYYVNWNGVAVSKDF